MIRSRSRARRIAKWAGLVVCMGLSGSFVLSVVLDLSWVSVGGLLGGGASGGIAWAGVRSTPPTPGVTLSLSSSGYSFEVIGSDFCFSFSFLETWGDSWGVHPEWGTAFGVSYVTIPLLPPLLFAAVGTFILWRRDRPPKTGHCVCGYNLEGNVSGRCPECGAEVEAE